MPRDDKERPTLTPARQQLTVTKGYAPLLYLSLKKLVQDIDQGAGTITTWGNGTTTWDNLEEARALLKKVEARP